MRKILAIITISISMAGCANSPHSTTGDDVLTIQSHLKKKERGSLAFAVRIFSHRKNDEKKEKQLNEQMGYGIDSCFYRIYKGKREFPTGILPVASGIRNCYEYILLFDDFDGNIKQEQLVYRDRYISGKAYNMILR